MRIIGSSTWTEPDSSIKNNLHGLYDRSGDMAAIDDHKVWTAPRVHPLLGTDSSNRTLLRMLSLPQAGLDVIIDDASHALAHQLVALEALWPRLKANGFYIVEDLTIGALPWMRGAAGLDQHRRAPTNNSNCGNECYYAVMNLFYEMRRVGIRMSKQFFPLD